ncbi:uncharacterized protein Dwil_GK10755 [Drosophila willistoni]|uniref:RYamide n=1 Tax=Drosophila willistoni TaxID=7260 RepID=B4MIZ6_DROWI|nr:uncharacterized protein LOC6637955 [Drosophila willistoni]EDW72085.1 uncharacterized protein Dwil_GK10755 [Drosophila willistoni]
MLDLSPNLCFLLLAISAVLVQNVGATAPDHSYADSALEKDNEMPTMQKRPAFFVGSRYGRSSGSPASAPAGVGSSKSRRLIIVPRNDRFFLGSRYGKRNGEYLSPYEQDSLGRALEAKDSPRESNQHNPGDSRPRPGAIMSCVYTGIGNYFRCSNANNELNNIMNSSIDETMDSAGMTADDANTK